MLITDDGWATSPKAWAIPDASYRLHDAARQYCARNHTDGIVPTNQLRSLTPHYRRAQIRVLVRAGLWKTHGTGHYKVLDFFPLNKSMAEIEARSRANRRNINKRWGNGPDHLVGLS